MQGEHFEMVRRVACEPYNTSSDEECIVQYNARPLDDTTIVLTVYKVRVCL